MMQGSLAEKLRVLRARMGLSLTEAATRAGVTRDTLSDLEHGKRQPYMPTLSKIAAGYGVPVEDLLKEPEIQVAGPPKASAPPETERTMLPEADVLGHLAQLWEQQLSRGYYDRVTLEKMYLTAGILAVDHALRTSKFREDLRPDFVERLEAAEERFAAVDSQIWKALELSRGRGDVPADELAAKRDARRRELRGLGHGAA